MYIYIYFLSFSFFSHGVIIYFICRTCCIADVHENLLYLFIFKYKLILRRVIGNEYLYKKILNIAIKDLPSFAVYRCLYTGTGGGGCSGDDTDDVVHKLMNISQDTNINVHIHTYIHTYTYMYIYNLSTGSVSSFHEKCTVIVRIITLI